MRPCRTPETLVVFHLPGGTEENDLWVRRGQQNGLTFVESVWALEDNERAAIAAGATVELRVYAQVTPAVSLEIGPSLEERHAEPSPDDGRIDG
jgi:uncharacterized protein (UPF0303 family)